jgi:phage baseplate assembly protein gpV
MLVEAIKRLRITDPAGYIIESVMRFGFERMFNRYYGIYRAIVIDNVDPERRGRCRVLVPSIGQQSEQNIPANLYAIPCSTGLSVGKSGQPHGCFFPPDIGDQVFVVFEDGLPANPIYLGGWIHAGTENGGVLRSQDAHIKGIRTKYGHYISFNDESGAITVERGAGEGAASGTKVTLNGPTISVVSQDGSNIVLTTDTVTVEGTDGSKAVIGADAITLTNATGTKIEASGSEVSVTAIGNITIQSDTKIALKAPQVDIGKGPAFEPAVMGQTFSAQYATHVHASAAPTLPTTPQLGLVPAVLNGLSLGVRVSS